MTDNYRFKGVKGVSKMVHQQQNGAIGPILDTTKSTISDDKIKSVNSFFKDPDRLSDPVNILGEGSKINSFYLNQVRHLSSFGPNKFYLFI